MSKRALVELIGGLVFLAFALGVLMTYPRLKDKARELAGQAQAWEKATRKARVELKTAQDEAHKATLEVDRVRKRLAQLPKDPGPAHVPAGAEATEIANGLGQYGLHPGVLKADLLINPGDGRTIWGWAGEARRVQPLLEQVEGQKALADATGKEKDAALAQVKTLKDVTDSQDEQIQSLQKALAAQPRSRDWRVGGLVDTDRGWGIAASRAWGPLAVQAEVRRGNASVGLFLCF